MLRAKVRSVSNHPIYNPNRAFLHVGYIEDGIFFYDGNWVAEDNGMYRYDPEGEDEVWELPSDAYEVICTWDKK